MANLMMFCALLLVAVMPDVYAQSSSASFSSFATASTSMPASTMSSVTAPNSPGSTMSPASKPSKASSFTTKGPTQALTKAPVEPTTVQPNTSRQPTGTVQPTSTVQSTATVQPTTSGQPTTKPIMANSFFCTNLDQCCEGIGNTSITYYASNKRKQTLSDVRCSLDETTHVCCSAGILNASFIMTLVGIFFFLI